MRALVLLLLQEQLLRQRDLSLLELEQVLLLFLLVLPLLLTGSSSGT